MICSYKQFFFTDLVVAEMIPLASQKSCLNFTALGITEGKKKSKTTGVKKKKCAEIRFQMSWLYTSSMSPESNISCSLLHRWFSIIKSNENLRTIPRIVTINNKNLYATAACAPNVRQPANPENSTCCIVSVERRVTSAKL